MLIVFSLRWPLMLYTIDYYYIGHCTHWWYFAVTPIFRFSQLITLPIFSPWPLPFSHYASIHYAITATLRHYILHTLLILVITLFSFVIRLLIRFRHIAFHYYIVTLVFDLYCHTHWLHDIFANIITHITIISLRHYWCHYAAITPLPAILIVIILLHMAIAFSATIDTH